MSNTIVVPLTTLLCLSLKTRNIFLAKLDLTFNSQDFSNKQPDSILTLPGFHERRPCGAIIL